MICHCSLSLKRGSVHAASARWFGSGREEERNCEDAGSVIWCYIYAARVGVELLDYFSFKVRLSDCLILLAGRVQRYR